MGKSFDSRSTLEEELDVGYRCFLYNIQEKTIDHILLHCIKETSLWHILFSIFGLLGITFPGLRETLLDWCGSFVGRKQKKV